jgi:CBS domain-containing protein
MLVHEVMSTGLVTVTKTDTVRSAVIKMMNRHCGAIPVVEGDAQRLIGMVTLRDVLLPLYPNYGDYMHDNVHSRDFVEMEQGYPEALGGKVEKIMSQNPLTVAPHDPILEAASYMGLKNFRRIPVVDKGMLVGMVSLGDINRGLFFEKGMRG